MLNDVKLLIDNKNYTKWTDINISLSLDRLSGTFYCNAVNEPALLDAVDTQDIIEISIGQDKIMTAYLDNIKIKTTPDSNEVVFSGRNKLCDLIDCSALNKPGTWNNIYLQALIYELTRPFGINVKRYVDLGDNLRSFAIDTGQSVFEAISKACALKGILPIADADGTLVLTEVGSDGYANDPLVYGINIKSYDASKNYSNRYSEYTVGGSYSEYGKGFTLKNLASLGKATDEYITRYRPLHIKMDDDATSKVAQERANWEAQVRAGKSLSFVLTVKGWRQSNGALWKINYFVTVKIAPLNLIAILLITGVNYIFNDIGGRITILTVQDPIIYKTQPKNTIKKKKRAPKIKWMPV